LKACTKEAEEYFLKSVEFFQKSNHLAFAAYSNFELSVNYLDIGQYDKSSVISERTNSFWQHLCWGQSNLNLNKICKALAQVMNNEEKINLDEIYKWHEQNKNKWTEGVGLNCIGTILLNIDDQHISEAEDWIKRSIETNKKYGMVWNLARDYALYAKLFNRKGDRSKAKENLGKAIEIMTDCGADGWVKNYEDELAQL
jgi:tetratricopeptide (TPR) repeat protein